jgi:hypothetical protein
MVVATSDMVLRRLPVSASFSGVHARAMKIRKKNINTPAILMTMTVVSVKKLFCTTVNWGVIGGGCDELEGDGGGCDGGGEYTHSRLCIVIALLL